MMKKIILYVFVAIVVLCTGVVIYLYNKPHQKIDNIKPEVELTAQEVFDTFSQDEAKANELYLGKIVAIKGEIVLLNKKNPSQYYLSFIDPVFGVTCTFDNEQDDESLEKIIALKPGDVVWIKGRIDGFLTDVRISKCYLIKKQS